MSERRSARRSARGVPTRADGVPLELLAGPCIEVWVAADERPPAEGLLGEPTWRAHQARRRFENARQAWAKERGLTTRQMCELMPSGSAYSAAYLVENGRGDYARERLGALADEVLGKQKTTRRRRP